MDIKQIPVNNFSARKPNAVIDTIVLHHTALKSSEEVFKIFKNPKLEVSSHYLIDRDGTIFQFVEEEEKAWHAGVSFWGNRTGINDYSIGIELDNNGEEDFSHELMESLVELCHDIRSRHDIKHILAHGDVAPGRKVDPSHLFDWKFLSQNDLGYFPKAIDYTPKVLFSYKDEDKKICYIKSMLKEIGYHVENVNDNYDQKTDVVMKAFKRHYSPETYLIEGWDTLADARLTELHKHICEA